MLYIVVCCGILVAEVFAMKLYYDRKSADPTYFVQMGFRVGNKTSTKNVKRIGKYSELLGAHPDPLEYAKEVVAQMNEELKNNQLGITFTIDLDEKVQSTGDRASKSTVLNIGYLFLQSIYQKLDLNQFFKDITADSKVTFDCNEINRFMTFSRILEPKSKLATMDVLGNYYEKPDFDYQHVMRYMTILEKNFDAYMETLFNGSENVVKRNTSVCYFDCTNYYFEIEKEDDEMIDPITGEVMRGFRRYGVSKEHRPNPIVQMGLFMDGDGIPISMCMNSGSAHETLCAVPLEKKIVKMFKNKPFIYCADAGLASLGIREYNAMQGRAFIVTQSIKMMSNELKDQIFSGKNFKWLSDDRPCNIEALKEFDRNDPANLDMYNDMAYRVLPASTLVETGLFEEKIFKNGKSKMIKSKAKFDQQVIVTFSRKMFEYNRSIRNRQYERAQRLLDTKDPEEIKKGPNDVRRFIKLKKSKTNGVSKVEYVIDEDKKLEEEKYDGYYALATNLNDNVKDILAINSGRYKIEDCFRVMKTHFDARPVEHQSREHITAHFMICYTALLVYRLLEVSLNRYGEHLTPDELISTIRNMNVSGSKDKYYQSLFKGSIACTALNALTELGLDKQYYQAKDLNKIVKKITKQSVHTTK